MGVSGCGKTTIGRLLSSLLNIPFHDGDDYHSEENKRKMSSNLPLTDVDRAPWLESLSLLLSSHEDVILACSALRRCYRDRLASRAGGKLLFVYLAVTREEARDRISRRRGHYFGEEMVDSQFQTLEEPGEEEEAVTVDATEDIDVIGNNIVTILSRY